LVRNRAKAAGLEKIPTVEIVEGDMSKRSTLGPALDGVDRVLMISAPLMNMVETQNTFIDAAKAAGVRHVIKFSGLDARQDTTFPFGLMHKDIRLVRQAGGEVGTPLPSAAVADEILGKAEALGYTHRDIASLHEALGRMSKDAAVTS